MYYKYTHKRSTKNSYAQFCFLSDDVDLYAIKAEIEDRRRYVRAIYQTIKRGSIAFNVAQ